MPRQSTTPPFPNCPCCNPSLHTIAQHWLQAVTSRRLFLLGTGSFTGAIALSSLPATARTQPTSSPSPIRQGQIADAADADAIYTDGTILTMSDAQPTAVAVAVKDGKILAVGSKEEVRSFQGPDTQLINLEGHTLVPGFIDGHGHVVAQGMSATMANLLPPPDGTVDTMAKLQDTLRAWSKSPISQKFGLIIGNGYDDSQLVEQRHPNRDDLDAVSTELPVVAIHQSGHLGAYNSKALEMLGITADTPNPQGGVYERRPNSQEPNGVMEEAANSIAQSEILSQTVKIGPEQASEVVGLVEKGLAIYAQYGFTTAQEGLGNPGYFEVLKLGVHENRLNADIPLYMEYFMAATNAHELDWSRREYHGHLRLAGGKLVLDGSPQGRTAWLTEPFYKPPAGQPADYLGYPILTDEQLLERIETGFKNNFQLICHCNGDAASDQLIRIVRTLTEKHGVADRRVVMIHAQMVREDQLDAMQELGIIPSFFPSHTFYWGDWHRDVTLGPERAARISPTRSALQRGMKFTIHNDAPVVMPHAMRLLWSTVNRRTRSNQVLGADQAISPLDGLKALTIWGAYQHFEEDIKGSIEVGKLADFAILSDNPTSIDPLLIQDITVLETIKEGKTIYKADSQTPRQEEHQ